MRKTEETKKSSRRCNSTSLIRILNSNKKGNANVASGSNLVKSKHNNELQNHTNNNGSVELLRKISIQPVTLVVASNNRKNNIKTFHQLQELKRHSNITTSGSDLVKKEPKMKLNQLKTPQTLSKLSQNNNSINPKKSQGERGGSKLTTDQSNDDLAIKMPIFNSTKPHKFGENADLINI